MSNKPPRIGFTAVLSRPDPNCIVLTSTTSHRLGTELGTFDDDLFSIKLETFITEKNIEINKYKNKYLENKILLQQQSQFSKVKTHQVYILAGFLAISIVFNFLLLVHH